jgi:tellurite resistance protein
MGYLDGTDGMAYALATWSRFDNEVSDELLRGICGVFALVSAADGCVSRSEIDRFAKVISDNTGRFRGLDEAKIDGLFRQLGQAIVSDPEAGRRRVLSEIAALRDDKKSRELVYGAALIAIEADGRALSSEQEVLGEIAQTLGL